MFKIQLCMSEIHYILKYITTENLYFQLKYRQYCTILVFFFCIIDQINEGLMCKIYAMFKHIQNSNFWPVHFCMIPENWLAEASQLGLYSTHLIKCVATQGSKLRPFWSHMLPKCNLCDSKIYLGAFVRVQIIAVVRPLQFSAKRWRITAQHVPRDRELKQVKLFIRALV